LERHVVRLHERQYRGGAAVSVQADQLGACVVATVSNDVKGKIRHQPVSVGETRRRHLLHVVDRTSKSKRNTT